jgi:hypothetical protein
MIRYINYIENQLGRFYQRIISNSTTEGLSNYRAIIGLFYISIFSGWSWIANSPHGFYDPPILSIGNLFSSFPSPWLCYIADFLFVIFLVLFTFGIRVRISLMALFLIGIVMSSFENSFGKIDHTSLSWFTFLLLCFTSIDGKQGRPGTSLIAVMISFGLFTAGFQKMFNWVDFDLQTSGFLKWFFECYFRVAEKGLLADVIFDLPMVVIEFMDYAAVFIELTAFVWLLLGKNFWRGYLIVLCFFHLLNELFLKISFAPNSIIYGIFIIAPLLSNVTISKGVISFLLIMIVSFKYVIDISNFTSIYLETIWWSLFLTGGIYLLLKERKKFKKLHIAPGQAEK